METSILDAQGQLTRSMVEYVQNSKLLKAFMYVLVTCKFEKDLIKNS